MKRKNAALGFIFITVFVDVVGLGLIIPITPDLIGELIGGTTQEASGYARWLIVVYALCQFVCGPILGGLSDQFGRRPVLLISLFGFAVDYIFLALAPTIGWLFVARIISGIGGASYTTASAYIADISSPEDRAKNFGLIGAAFGLGFVIGPVVGGLLGEIGTRVPFFAAAGLTALNWLYGYFVVPESLPKENRRKFNWKRANPVGTLMHLRNYPLLTGMLVVLLFIYVGQHATHSTWAFFTKEQFTWTPVEVGLSLGFVGVVIAIVQGGLVRPVVSKLGQVKAVIIGLSFNAAGLLLMGLASEGWMIYAIMVPYALGGLAGPALQGIMTAQVPANEQGELQGGITSLQSLTNIVGPLVMLSLFHHYSDPTGTVYFPGAPFLLGTLLAATSLVIAIKSLRGKNV